MATVSERISAWNRQMNDIPRKCLIVAGVVLCCYGAVKLFPYCWPFVIALLFASILEPAARGLRRLFRRFRAGRAIATLLCMAVLFGLLTVVFFGLAGRLVNEGVNLLRAVPDAARSVINRLTEWLNGLYNDYSRLLPEDFMARISEYLNGLLSSVLSVAANISTRIASFTVSTATSLPIILISVVFIVMGTFYFSYDRERIAAFFNGLFPTQVVRSFRLIKSGVFSAVFGQVRAQIFISCVQMVVMVIGLIVLRQPYALLLGVLIGVADMLPVIGAGLFLNSWAIVDLLLGNYSAAIGLFVLYLITAVVRQVIEPRIVGKQLGLYPLVTMASMFAGFQIMGTLGLIAGPLVANICRVALDADAGRLGAAPPRQPLGAWLKGVKNNLLKKR